MHAKERLKGLGVACSIKYCVFSSLISLNVKRCVLGGLNVQPNC